MGLFNWFFLKPAARQSLASTQTDIHATLADATRPSMPVAARVPVALAQQNNNSSTQRLEQRRSERNARRELLFQVVRESMVRVGVLSSAFKFKVLALDQRGRTFLVMMDLSAEFAGETDKLSEIEALISQSAKVRYELVVQAVYWRFYDTVVSNAASRQAAAQAIASAPSLAPALATTAKASPRPAPLSTQPFSAAPKAALNSPAIPVRPATGAAAKADPLEHDEVEAFKRALASGAQPGLSIPLGGNTPSAFDTTQVFSRPVTPVAPTAAKVAPVAANAASLVAAATAKAASLAAINNKLLLTGYEDTEMPDPDAPVLSATQYGELR